MVTLRSLVTAAPFDEEMRKTILEKIDKNELDDGQKMQMSDLCWSMIFTLYETELRLKFDEIMMEVAEGKKKYSKNDYQEFQAKLIYRLSSQLEAGTTEKEIEEVKKKLQSFSANTKT